MVWIGSIASVGLILASNLFGSPRERATLALLPYRRLIANGLPAVMVAWLLGRRRFPGRTLFDAFVHLPLVMPPVVTGYLLLLTFGRRGPVGAFSFF